MVLRLSLLIVSAALLVACGDELPFAPASTRAAPDPSTYGPYPVGVKTIELIDNSRMGQQGEPRKIVTEIWYPAVASARGGTHVRYYAVDIFPEAFVEQLNLTGEQALETLAVRDAKLREEDEPYPIILFSHGNGGVRMQSTHLTVALASHGYVVLSPDHYGNTLKDMTAGTMLDADAILQSYVDRPADLSYLLDWLEHVGDKEPVAKVADLSRVGVVGHSLGAITAMRVTGLDRRIKATVAQAPAGYLVTWLDIDRRLDEVTTPIMLHVGGEDRILPREEHANTLWAAITPPRYRVDFPTAGHFTFSDLCTLDLEAIGQASLISVGQLLEDGCGSENITPESAFPLIRWSAIGLLNGVLRDSPGSLDTLSTSPSPEVEIVSEP